MNNTSTTEIPTTPTKSPLFFGLQSEEIRDAFIFYHSADPAQKADPPTLIHLLSAHLSLAYDFPTSAADLLAARLIEYFSGPEAPDFIDPPPEAPQPADPAQTNLILTLEDYQKFIELVTADPNPPPHAHELLLAFVALYRRNFHPSGWVRYSRREIFYLAGLHKLSAASQEKLTVYLHQAFELNMRVVGSNTPTTCFDLPWLRSQPPISPANPLITLGPLTPETIATQVQKIHNNKIK